MRGVGACPYMLPMHKSWGRKGMLLPDFSRLCIVTDAPKRKADVVDAETIGLDKDDCLITTTTYEDGRQETRGEDDRLVSIKYADGSLVKFTGERGSEVKSYEKLKNGTEIYYRSYGDGVVHKKIVVKKDRTQYFELVHNEDRLMREVYLSGRTVVWKHPNDPQKKPYRKEDFYDPESDIYKKLFAENAEKPSEKTPEASLEKRKEQVLPCPVKREASDDESEEGADKLEIEFKPMYDPNKAKRDT